MIPKLEYIRPKNIPETLDLLARHQQDARILAGGTDIIPGFRMQSSRFADIKLLLDIHRLAELNILEKRADSYIIGPAVEFTRLGNHPDIRHYFPALAKAALSVGCMQIRNRATIGGNFINNAPCADTVPPLLVYNAKIRVCSVNKKQDVPLAEFLQMPYKTKLSADEMVTQITLPIPKNTIYGDFYKLGRRRGTAISRISLALLVEISDSIVKDLRIASGSVTPIGKRFPKLEQFAIGKKAQPALFKEMAQNLGREILEITGLRWSSPYKLPVVQQCFYQLLAKICHQADPNMSLEG